MNNQERLAQADEELEIASKQLGEAYVRHLAAIAFRIQVRGEMQND